MSLSSALGAEGLVWQPVNQELHPTVEQERVSAAYVLTNQSGVEQRITALQVNCDCAGVRAEPETVAPGGTATVTCDYELADRRGIQRKQVTVELTDAGGAVSSHRLGLVIHIPEPIKPARTVLFWRKDSIPRTQGIPVRIDDPEQYRLLEVADMPAGFTVELVERQPGLVICNITPNSVAEEVVHRVQLISNHPSEKFRRIPLVLMVK